MNNLWDSLSQVANMGPTQGTSSSTTTQTTQANVMGSAGKLPKLTKSTSNTSSKGGLGSSPGSRDSNRLSVSSFFDDFFTGQQQLQQSEQQQSITSPTKYKGVTPVSMTSSTSTVNQQQFPDKNNGNYSASVGGYGSGYTQQLADKLMERVLSMAIPTTTTETGEELPKILDRIEIQKTRPQLSINVMSKNSILLLSRLSVPFEMIDNVVILFSWSKPIYTITVLTFVTLLILKPILLLALPFFYTCFEIIVPAFLKRHPIDPITGIPSDGPMIKKIELPKPVPELSREFLLNVTDLQNHMLLYVIAWDFTIKWTLKFLYFKDENMTSFIFLSFLSTGISITLFGSWFFMFFLPLIKVVLVVSVWTFTVMMHPNYRDQLLSLLYSEDTRLGFVTWTNKLESKLKRELKCKEVKEVKEIEIYELQTLNPESLNWDVVCFTNEIYSVNSHCKLNNLPIVGTLQLNNVKAPKGWTYINNIDDKSSPRKDSKSSKSRTSKVSTIDKTVVDGWSLDLTPNQWVHDNYLKDVIEVDEDSKWCYDLITKMENNLLGIGKNHKKARGVFRRRRWVRCCIRDFYDPLNHDEFYSSDDDDTDDANSSDAETEDGDGSGVSTDEIEFKERSLSRELEKKATGVRKRDQLKKMSGLHKLHQHKHKHSSKKKVHKRGGSIDSLKSLDTISSSNTEGSIIEADEEE